MKLVSGGVARIRRRLSRSSRESTIAFGILPLDATPEQLSYWEEHPNEAKVFHHTEETARAVRGQPVAPVKAAMFAFRLPFDLPVPTGSAFGLRRSPDPDEPMWVMLMVHRVNVELAAAALAPYERGLAVLLGEAEPDLNEGSSAQTWILAHTLNVGFDDEPFEVSLLPGGGISIGFERCLRAINMVCDASRLVARDIYSRPLTKDSLDPKIVWFEEDDETGVLADRHEMRLHKRAYNPRTVVPDPEEMHQLLSEAVSRRLESEAAMQPHPLLVPRLLALQAGAQRWYGEASASIITLHAAAETLLGGLYRLLLVDQGLDSTEIKNRMHASFKSVLRTHLPAHLGGRWTGLGTVPEQYWTDVYGVRNALVHEGEEPSWWTFNTAAKSYDALVEFVDERLLVGWRNHPRALIAWCEPWAGGTMALPPAAQPIADALRQERHPYWLPCDLAGR